AIRAADPHLEVILGHFLTNEVRLPRADGAGLVRVVRTEEKGSDVNIATHLLHDAHRGAMECAVLITNDSDLLEPVRIVRQEIGLPVGILFPVANAGRKPSAELLQQASFVRQIRSSLLRQCQLPNPVPSPTGAIFKPAGW
ncbi:MAG: NYN domain-containing protein, partial [Gemmatimonadetes bacterium]|nr:NYN domain-containing protein [Gemmatimonadota bacterium]